MDQVGYQIKPFSRSRQMVAESLSLADHKHIIHGLLDVDVTAAREVIRDREARTGEQLSFTAFIIACFARAIGEDKTVQAYRLGSRKLIEFDDVDVGTVVERTTTEGEKVVRGHVIRAADKRSYPEINREIQEMRTRPVEKVMSPQIRMAAAVALALPVFLRRIFNRIVFGDPRRLRHLTGTAFVTAVGMFGEGGGWGIPVPGPVALMLTLGGIMEKPAIVDGRIEPREFMSLTISFDHDVTDGAAAARFATRLKELIEASYGLAESGDGEAAREGDLAYAAASRP